MCCSTLGQKSVFLPGLLLWDKLLECGLQHMDNCKKIQKIKSIVFINKFLSNFLNLRTLYIVTKD